MGNRDELPRIPVTAVVWAIRLAAKPPQLPNAHRLVLNRWRGVYGDITPSRVEARIRHAVDRGWLALSGDGKWARVRMGDEARFDAEHDPGLLRGGARVLGRQYIDQAAAWRAAHQQEPTDAR